MIWEREDQAELAVDIAAAALFAVAIGFAAWAAAAGGKTAALSAATAFLATGFGLRRIEPEIQTHALPAFVPEAVAPTAAAVDELVLEDALGEVGPHARVVRLFGRSQSHLPSNLVKPALPDASEALSTALAELRRSLR